MAKETTITEFNGLAEIVEHCTKLPAVTGFEGRPEWQYGSYSTLANTLACINAGNVNDSTMRKYMSIREEIEPLFDSLRSEFLAVSRKRRRVVSDDGDDIDMDRYMNRDSDCWVSARRGGKMRQIVLGVNFAHLSESSERDFVEIGALAAATGDLLSLSGFPVEIRLFAFSANTSFRNGKSSCVTFPVKRAEDALDPKAILTSSIPGMFRDLVFRIRQNVFGHVQFSTTTLTEELKQQFGIDFVISRDSTGEYKLMLEGLIRNLKGGE